MVFELRSGRKIMSRSNPIMDNINNLPGIEQLLKPLEENIKKIQDSFTALRSLFTTELDKLRTRINVLESRCALNEHFLQLQARKIDDNEQYSRKTNLRLSIPAKKDEAPATLMNEIQDCVTALDIGLLPGDYDRCHRDGQKYNIKGKVYQDVLLRLCSWRARNNLWQNRKKLPFKVFADLTSRRSKILKLANNGFYNQPEMKKVIKFVFCDVNCKLKVCTVSEKFFGFSSEMEFLNIVSRLENDATLSEEFLQDENDELFY